MLALAKGTAGVPGVAVLGCVVACVGLVIFAARLSMGARITADQLLTLE